MIHYLCGICRVSCYSENISPESLSHTKEHNVARYVDFVLYSAATDQGRAVWFLPKIIHKFFFSSLEKNHYTPREKVLKRRLSIIVDRV